MNLEELFIEAQKSALDNILRLCSKHKEERTYKKILFLRQNFDDGWKYGKNFNENMTEEQKKEFYNERNKNT